jgi:hypothetical protein
MEEIERSVGFWPTSRREPTRSGQVVTQGDMLKKCLLLCNIDAGHYFPSRNLPILIAEIF